MIYSLSIDALKVEKAVCWASFDQATYAAYIRILDAPTPVHVTDPQNKV